VTRSAELDGEAAAFLVERVRHTAAEFGTAVDEIPVLEWGEVPQLDVRRVGAGAAILVARAGADWWRIRYQIAHEVFHWVCGPRVFHWTHEMLAVETALRAMRELGEDDYARRNIDALVAEADCLSLATMLTTPVVPGPLPGLYGRAWVTGACLVEAVGWERLKLLAGSFDANGNPDVASWLRALPDPARSRAEAVLGSPTPPGCSRRSGHVQGQSLDMAALRR
jgi:hypothetical protein